MIINQVAYRIQVGRWTSKQRMAFGEAKFLQMKVDGCFSKVVIVAERE